MMQAPRRATVRGPTFIRTLARLTAADLPQPTRSLSDQLSHWIDWTHAVALSTVLDRPAAALDDEGIDSAAEADECARVRAALTGAIVGDAAFAAPPRAPASSTTDADDGLDYAFFRQRYLFLQQTMEAGVGRLRERLRQKLSAQSADLARLAAVDAVMERALSRRERSLLSVAPVLLAERFEFLRQSARDGSDDARVPGEAPAAAGDAWPDVFRKDMQDVLLAELDVRLQPAQGLLAALATNPHG
ncbi:MULTISPECIES: DUF3348 domain-containing protein [unclassified Lysobacter]|uniref:DUF3348 domain-containing protein n=1 Tax=unclassified Lysobacter TaxID=2635362 RepID=UPI001BEA16BD|nr:MULTISPECIES: DUF3348 domain-containing protein [unclassified Lysobacter]MBT2747689.1 DUF3348 domain-containing protein [Lysobacter sp. ISL-42]MBT2752830.1 DUF3348 domain-containing protein [Lysobacter sp. ISL-50]MBT2779714.1 DUF3348 domain-containing protein [Lysobacter sp. ISL-54]MBT2780107.1 DUF3348 domain-containing protein [Lysobacter sp. ISL-52]